MENAARAWDLIFDKLEGDQALLDFCGRTDQLAIRTIKELR